MKKYLLVMMALFATTFTALAATVTVTFNNGQNMEGQLVNLNDTALVIRAYYAATGDKEITILPERVRYFNISGIGRYDVEDGKFVPSAKAKAKLEKTRVEREAHAQLVSERAANPNLVIGNALKKGRGDVLSRASLHLYRSRNTIALCRNYPRRLWKYRLSSSA